jgi:hypothetical protein
MWELSHRRDVVGRRHARLGGSSSSVPMPVRLPCGMASALVDNYLSAVALGPSFTADRPSSISFF